MGGKHEEFSIREKIKKYGLDNSVKVEYIFNVEEILKNTLIYLATNETNNYPSQALLEAMACGCAIIATDVGETRKLVDAEVGFLVKQDSEVIADKIKFLLKNPEVAKEMGRKARERVMKDHSIERYGGYLLSIYENLIAEKGN